MIQSIGRHLVNKSTWMWQILLLFFSLYSQLVCGRAEPNDRDPCPFIKAHALSYADNEQLQDFWALITEDSSQWR